MDRNENNTTQIDRHVTRDYYSTMMLMSYGYELADIKRSDDGKSDVFILEKKLADGDADAKQIVEAFRRKKLRELGELPDPFELLVENRARIAYLRNLTQKGERKNVEQIKPVC